LVSLRSLTMTRASCLPLKKGPFNFSTNRVFTLLENDGSESSVTLQHFGQSNSEPSLAREKSAGRREQVRKLPFLLFHINFSRVQTKIDRIFLIYNRQLQLVLHMRIFTLNSYSYFQSWDGIYFKEMKIFHESL